MKHYGPRFAVLLCRWIGHRGPLIARLRDPAEPKTQHEMEYLADVLADPNHRWPTPGQVDESRKHLRRAAYYLEFLWTDGKLGKKMAALEHVRLKCKAGHKKIDLSTAQRSLNWAKKLAGGEWWKSAEHLAKKGLRKSESLHRTY
jgi:hypothetical protein